MPRTTINIDASVLAQLKKRSRREKKSIGEVVSELLARSLDDPKPDAEPFEWISGRMDSRFDLEDKDRLRDILDE